MHRKRKSSTSTIAAISSVVVFTGLATPVDAVAAAKSSVEADDTASVSSDFDSERTVLAFWRSVLRLMPLARRTILDPDAVGVSFVLC